MFSNGDEKVPDDIDCVNLIGGSRKVKECGKRIPHQSQKHPWGFKHSGLISWKHSTDTPTSVGHLAFLLDCFVISFGPEMPQLGRYHPQSDPEEYAVEMKPEDEEWTLSDDEDYDEPTITVPWTTNYLNREEVKFDKVGGSYKKKLRANNPHQSRSFHDRTCFCGTLPEDVRNTYSFMNWEEPNPQPEADSLENSEFPNDDVIRELSEMRLILERLLENRDLLEFYDGNGLRDILALLPDSNLGNLPIKEPFPHFPVGEWKFEECGICLVVQWLYRRSCCQYPACTSCLQKYYSQKIEQGIVKIECCNLTCKCYVHRDEISARLEGPMKERFHKLLILANEDATIKTCPRCNHVTKFSKQKRRNTADVQFTSVVCPACNLEWCFPCHAPWHENLTCRQFRKGDRLLKSWAKEKNHGQLNAQKCPKCKIYIQRTAGCDHMHCNRCKTDFCYKCGDRFRYLKFFGDHYSKLSIFGCKYRFKADRPVQRKFIRGAIFGGKVVAAPVLGALALCAGALAVGVGVVALPVYGGVRLYRHCEGRHHAKVLRRQPEWVRPCEERVTYLVMPED